MANDGYDNERRGALFKNKNKREDRQDPEYKGSATLAGVDYWVSAWINTSKAGEKYMGLTFQPKESPAVSDAKAAPSAPPPLDDLDDSSLPF